MPRTKRVRKRVKQPREIKRRKLDSEAKASSCKAVITVDPSLATGVDEEHEGLGWSTVIGGSLGKRCYR